MNFFLLSILVFASLACQAQFRTSTFTTPYGNANVTTYSPVRMNYASGQESPKQEFVIVLKGDSTLESKTRINIKGKPQSLTVKVAKKKKEILPSDTREIYRITDDGIKLTGMPADSCWLFKAVEGKINVYSNLAMRGYDYGIAIQGGENGPIVPYTIENLRDIIGDTPDQELQKMLKKRWLRSALKHYNEN